MRLHWTGYKWSLKTKDNKRYSAKTIIMTPPVPQALELIHNSQIGFPNEVLSSLSAISYEPCIALLLKGEISESRTKSAFIRPKGGLISLIVNNHVKGVSNEPGAVTIHTSRDFSEQCWDNTEDRLVKAILDDCREHVQYSGGYLRIHRWRYSRTINLHPERCLISDTPGIIAFAGDGFSVRDIEGAAMSGIGAAEEIISRIK